MQQHTQILTLLDIIIVNRALLLELIATLSVVAWHNTNNEWRTTLLRNFFCITLLSEHTYEYIAVNKCFKCLHSHTHTHTTHT